MTESQSARPKRRLTNRTTSVRWSYEHQQLQRQPLRGRAAMRNLCLSALLEAVRDRTKIVELKQVNRVLLQPHWRKEVDLPH